MQLPASLISGEGPAQLILSDEVCKLENYTRLCEQHENMVQADKNVSNVQWEQYESSKCFANINSNTAASNRSLEGTQVIMC